jgi:hypothetical protein
MVQERLPRWTPYLLERGSHMCRRRLALEHEGREKTQDVFTRWRLRDRLIGCLVQAHSVLAAPTMAQLESTAELDGLTAEEKVLFGRSISTYASAFASDPLQVRIDHPGDQPNALSELGVRLGGAVDVVGIGPTGDLEIRQLELWRRPLNANPHASWAMALVVLRLHDWAEGKDLLLQQIDLLTGTREQYRYSPTLERDAILDRLGVTHRDLLGYMDEERPRVGMSCSGCGWAASCRALRKVS